MNRYLLAFLGFCCSVNIQAQVIDTIKLEESTLVLRTIAKDLFLPWDMDWGADGHIWFDQRDGQVFRLNPDTKEMTRVYEATDVYQSPDNSGAHAFAMHPDFPAQPYLYMHYTNGEYSGKLVRYTYRFNDQKLMAPLVLIDSIHSNHSHNGSRIVFDEEGYLYLCLGDGYFSNDAQNTDVMHGKILRLHDDGRIPDSNPIAGSYIWSYGHRNPQGLCFGKDGILYSSEHGDATDDEINIIHQNRNYGWPVVEGYCDTPSEQAMCDSLNVVEPIWAYTPTDAPCGLAYFDHPSIPEWRHSLILALLKDQRFDVLKLSEDGLSIEGDGVTQHIERVVGRIRDVLVSPNGRLFICTSNKETKHSASPDLPQEGYDRIIEVVNINYDYPEYVTPEKDVEVEVYPNPARDFVMISKDTEVPMLRYQMTDLNGNVISEGELETSITGFWQIPIPEQARVFVVLNYEIEGFGMFKEKVMIYREK